MYRVRKSWDDPGSQLGAYVIYKNAFIMANNNPGYSIYDEAGVAVYSATQKVQTMSYRAKLLRKVGNHPKGSRVTVGRNLDKAWVMADGTIVKKKGYMDLLTQIYDADCKYTKETAEGFINAIGVGSKTEWLIWCSKYCQKVYIFKGSKGHWELQRTNKCGTGNIAYGDGSDQGVGFSWKIWDKQKQFQGSRAVQYWNMHYSSMWGNSIHQGTVGRPSTHGCISMGSAAVQWVFNNIPINTRVVVY